MKSSRLAPLLQQAAAADRPPWERREPRGVEGDPDWVGRQRACRWRGAYAALEVDAGRRGGGQSRLALRTH